MTSTTSGPQDTKVRTKRSERFHLFVGTRWVGVAIWGFQATIFLFDLLTHPENVSASFAYTIPIFMSLFEFRPRPYLYAAAATALSLFGSVVEPFDEGPFAAIIGNRLIAIASQWLAALLVTLQYQRHTHVQREAEFQRRFIDILSHEIGTALTAITGHAYRLTKLSGQLAPADLRVRADKIQKAAERIEAIMSRIQFASSLGDVTIPVDARKIDINALLQRLVSHFKEERSRPIELNLCTGPQFVAGDETLLHQAFENVIMNSLKYSPADSRISVNAVNHGRVISVAIADFGSGISLDDLSRVWEPYYRGSSSKGTSGAGLGLYFVERIVEAHKGTICIDSEVGKGTKVTIDLPQSMRLRPHE